MNSIKFLLLITIPFLLLNCSQKSAPAEISENSEEETREFYQFKTYIFTTDKQSTQTDLYLQKAFLPALKKLNISNVGVFKPRLKEGDTIKKTHLLIPFATMQDFLELEEALSKDTVYLREGADYIKAGYNEPPYQRIESILIRAFVDFPKLQTPKLEGSRADRIYELRSYESATESYYKNKVDMFNAGGEVELFDKLEFNAVFYGEVISGSKMPNLMYMTTFSDQESRDAHWKSFFGAPEWDKLKNIEKYKNNVSHADIYFLYPTSYSDY